MSKIYCIKSIINDKLVASFVIRELKIFKLIWNPVSLLTMANLAICEVIIFLKLTVPFLEIFLILFVSLSIFFTRHLIYFGYFVQILVSVSTFLYTWSSISLSMELALINFLIKNKLSKKEEVFAAGSFKLVYIFGNLKMILDINT